MTTIPARVVAWYRRLEFVLQAPVFLLHEGAHALACLSLGREPLELSMVPVRRGRRLTGYNWVLRHEPCGSTAATCAISMAPALLALPGAIGVSFGGAPSTALGAVLLLAALLAIGDAMLLAHHVSGAELPAWLEGSLGDYDDRAVLIDYEAGAADPGAWLDALISWDLEVHA